MRKLPKRDWPPLPLRQKGLGRDADSWRLRFLSFRSQNSRERESEWQCVKTLLSSVRLLATRDLDLEKIFPTDFNFFVILPLGFLIFTVYAITCYVVFPLGELDSSACLWQSLWLSWPLKECRVTLRFLSIHVAYLYSLNEFGWLNVLASDEVSLKLLVILFSNCNHFCWSGRKWLYFFS